MNTFAGGVARPLRQPVERHGLPLLIQALGSVDLHAGREIVLPLIARHVRRAMSAHCLVVLINERSGKSISAYALEDSSDCPIRAEVELSCEECTLTRSGTPPLHTNTDAEPRLTELKGLLAAQDTKSLYLVPLTIGGAVVGSLGFGCKAGRPAEELSALEDTANVVALLIDRMLRMEDGERHRHELTRQGGWLRIDADVGRLIAETRDLQRIVTGCSRSLRNLVNHDYMDVALWDRGVNRLLVAGFEGARMAPLRARAPYPIEGSPAGRVFASGKCGFVTRSGATSASGWPADELRTLLCVPLTAPGERLGVLTVGWVDEVSFSTDVEDVLARIGARIAPVAENHLLSSAAFVRTENRSDLSVPGERLLDPGAQLGIVGECGILKETLLMLPRIAQSEASILIQGDTGTGKELIARGIHQLSSRRGGAFVKVNCAAIPSSLFESELFGYERGAFTGAITRKAGRVELSDGGTLFLDEVGDMPAELQAKLLTFIEERRLERLGSNKSVRIDTRFVAATNQNLQAMVRAGKFRADLYYRLNGIPIHLPPLSERPEDIPSLVRHFVRRHSQAMGKVIDVIPDDAMNSLVRRDWPGNIRELERFVEWAVVVSPARVLVLPDPPARSRVQLAAHPSRKSLREFERDQIAQVLAECNGVIGGPLGAAARLGLKRTTLQYKLRKFGLATAAQDR